MQIIKGHFKLADFRQKESGAKQAKYKQQSNSIPLLYKAVFNLRE